MNPKIALIDFPRLQEQIAARILNEQDIDTASATSNDLQQAIDKCQLALFFWTANRPDVKARYDLVASARAALELPLLLVTTESGIKSAETVLIGQPTPEFLVTPLQPQLMNAKIKSILGLPETAADDDMREFQYVKPFVTATVQTLKQMAGLDCAKTKVELRADARSQGDASAIMALAGKVEGFLAVSCSQQLAKAIARNMLELQEGQETEEDIIDSLGEIINIIAGSAKPDLMNTEHAFQLNIPNVVIGGPHRLGQPRSGVPIVVLAFMVGGMPFEVVVCIRPNRN
ncbi:chemotaxis protein CheX [candidate division KSB1 bacterium]|nr:chemotaxis protein CheX [candidate division KSB1 bacterium]